MNYIRFKGRQQERELIKAILSSSQAAILTKNFPQVSAIGKDLIVPDIDILQVKGKQESKILIGLEVKIAKLRKKKDKIIGFDWKQIYKGIGEAFFYFQYGVDQCGLILGFHENLRDVDIRWLCKYLEYNKPLFHKVLGSYFNLGIFRYEKGGIYEITKASTNFSYQSIYSNSIYGKELKKRIERFRNNLLMENFTWNIKLAQECEYAEKERNSLSPRFSLKK